MKHLADTRIQNILSLLLKSCKPKFINALRCESKFTSNLSSPTAKHISALREKKLNWSTYLIRNRSVRRTQSVTVMVLISNSKILTPSRLSLTCLQRTPNSYVALTIFFPLQCQIKYYIISVSQNSPHYNGC